MTDSKLPTDPAATSRAVTRPAWLTGLTTLVLILCAISNCAFALAPVVGARLDPSRSFVSEYSAQGEPGAGFYSAADIVTGLTLLLGCVLVWRVLPRRTWVRLGLVCLIAVATMTMADAVLPLDCVSTVDPDCRAAESRREVSFAHQLHGLTGILESSFIFVGMALIGLTLRRQPEWLNLARIALVLAAIYLAGNVTISVQYLWDVAGLGITQRLQIVTFSGFLIALAYYQRQIAVRASPADIP